MIGATSSLTYNVVGHIKTVLILTGGVMFFGDTMPPKKMAGIAAAMTGIVWCAVQGGAQVGLAEARVNADLAGHEAHGGYLSWPRRGSPVPALTVAPHPRPPTPKPVHCCRYSQIKLAEARQSAAAKLLPQAVSLNGEPLAR